MLNESSLFIANYGKHHQDIEQATRYFTEIRTFAIEHADKLKKQLEEYERQQYRFLLFTFTKAYELAVKNQIEYWFEYAKQVRSTRVRAVVKAIYECERGIYKTSRTILELFYHVAVSLIEYALEKSVHLHFHHIIPKI